MFYMFWVHFGIKLQAQFTLPYGSSIVFPVGGRLLASECSDGVVLKWYEEDIAAAAAAEGAMGVTDEAAAAAPLSDANTVVMCSTL